MLTLSYFLPLFQKDHLSSPPLVLLISGSEGKQICEILSPECSHLARPYQSHSKAEGPGPHSGEQAGEHVTSKKHPLNTALTVKTSEYRTKTVAAASLYRTVTQTMSVKNWQPAPAAVSSKAALNTRAKAGCTSDCTYKCKPFPLLLYLLCRDVTDASQKPFVVWGLWEEREGKNQNWARAAVGLKLPSRNQIPCVTQSNKFHPCFAFPPNLADETENGLKKMSWFRGSSQHITQELSEY